MKKVSPLFNLKFLLFALLFSAAFTATAQNHHHHRAKIFYSSLQDLQQLASLGIEIDHGSHKKGVFIESDFSHQDLENAKAAGFHTEVIIPDVQSFYLNRNKSGQGSEKAINNGCGTATIYEDPSNFELGSMGGFMTYDEVLTQLSLMSAFYPEIITVRAPISDFETSEGRSIFWMKISDNPNVDEDEPEMLYDAAHHAREPASVSSLVYYMWYLLENYDSDLEVKAIVDNTELYFVPVVNPDGYVFNGVTNPNGGGLWRKNRRAHDDGNFGVDNNRNYSVEWGTTGVTFETAGATYCGTEAFSEPENQAIKWMCENHEFQMAFNNHSYGNLLLYPFGYEVDQPTEDHDTFLAVSDEMVSQNGFTNQLSAELYPASGDSDDWMYVATPSKDRIYAFTPEIGGNAGGFWPASNQILPICQSTMYMNLSAAHMLTKYAIAEDNNPHTLADLDGNISFDLKRLGLQDADFAVTLEAISTNITFAGNESFMGLALAESVAGSIEYSLDPDIEEGAIIQFRFAIDNGEYLQFSPIIDKVYGTDIPQFVDQADNLNEWANADWDITTEAFVSAPSSITDSPNSSYNNEEIVVIELEEPLDLIGVEGATLRFMAKWDIEQGWDYAQVEISPNGGGTWIPQCGQYTVSGNENQDEGQPLYDGTQNEWVQENISLTDYIGSDEVLIRFRLVSDQFTTEDGFYFDDISVSVLSTVGVKELDLSDSFLSSSIPNPTAGDARIAYTLPQGVSKGELIVRNYLGQTIETYILKGTSGQLELPSSTYSAGVYFYTLVANGQSLETKQMIVR